MDSRVYSHAYSVFMGLKFDSNWTTTWTIIKSSGFFFSFKMAVWECSFSHTSSTHKHYIHIQSLIQSHTSTQAYIQPLTHTVIPLSPLCCSFTCTYAHTCTHAHTHMLHFFSGGCSCELCSYCNWKFSGQTGVCVGAQAWLNCAQVCHCSCRYTHTHTHTHTSHITHHAHT